MKWDETRLRHWREKVLSRAGHKCQKCGSKSNLHAHHIKQKSIHPHLAYVVSNGKCLCEKCHMALHKKIGFGRHTWEEIKQKFGRHVEYRTGKINSRINYSKMRLIYNVVKGSKVSHTWRAKRRK